MRQQYAWRSKLLAGALAFFALMIVSQMFRIQMSVEAAEFRVQAKSYSSETKTFYPDRGEIYDRNGSLLAGNQIVFEVGVNLNMHKDINVIASTVSTVLGLDYNQLLYDITNPPVPNLSYLVLADFVDEPKAKRLMEIRQKMDEQAPDGVAGALNALEFKSHPMRSYPEESLGSNILGFVNREGRGYFGVEEKYNDILAGNPVRVTIPTDPNQAINIPRIPDGSTLILTIDRDLQAAAEQTLDDALALYGAQNGIIMIIDPRNGETLAVAASKRMDLNKFWDYGVVYENASDFNPAISKPYEPGSVIKILTMAAALDSQTAVRSTRYLDTGAILVGGVEIRNWDNNAWGDQDMTGCLQHSLNVCMAWLSTQMGPETFYGYMNNFGLGHLTAVDMAGEAAGRLKVPGDADWYPVDLGTNAFGQGVAVTPIQLLTATSAVANHGRMVTPHVLYAMVRDGRQYNAPAQYAGTPIRAETADTLSDMLAYSLELESSNALVPGYRVAGKTGTAQIPVDGYYDETQTNASFIGWGPVDDPRFMIYVWLERPSASIWGSQTAAPVFSEMAKQTVVIMDIPPDRIRLSLASK